jgi:glycine dehydrogenase subunit 2
VRHYTRLSRQNYAIDLGLFPLGSCTMKHNPRLNEKVARLPGSPTCTRSRRSTPSRRARGDPPARPLAGDAVRHGISVAMSPKAGAHGELCGILAIRAALEAKGEGTARPSSFPESAHGTNPATAAFAGYPVEDIAVTADGRVDSAALQARLGPDVAG